MLKNIQIYREDPESFDFEPTERAERKYVRNLIPDFMHNIVYSIIKHGLELLKLIYLVATALGIILLLAVR